ncbi:antiviral reverse transcriptase Drt3b [Chryseobacterium sp.]|uniref:antiviral reverse transcriptase Drt3b n=1 Tax=Chryseobacterium sp. TaxID=1871047 RepID=UPI00289F4397|nr:antiviral reverse transcriptase Drt3b [Chryseobacterium sp.]
MRKKIKISYSKERVVLSDILPFEIPLIFSNRYFYKYLLKCENFNKKIDKKKEELKKTRNGVLKRKLETEIDQLNFHISILQTFAGNNYINKPMCFKIKHKESDYRELSLIHPINQKNVVEFYDKYKSLIIYYSSISPFSIRKPTKIANFTFYNDLLHKKNEDDCYEYSQIEEEDNEYENLRSFFAYHKYSNIHKFYESYQFHRSEKKFNNLLKIDVSKCFDSIYSHTIAWALFNKQIIKDNVNISLETFGGEFDKLMQTLNANETNGIVIGPEFSRIFAELILQQIDKCIFDNLLHNTENNKKLIHKRDYEIFRYVDDYFVFYNSESDKEIILKEFKICLKEYKLYLNEKKSITYDKPIITEISLAKQKISDLFSEHLKLNENKNDNDILKSIYFSSNNVITRFKTIVKETKVDYKDIMNYSLAVLENKTAKLIKKWHTFEIKNDNLQKQYEKGFLEILDVSFFLYSVSPRVNSTIKLSLILNKIIAFLKKNKSNLYKEPLLNHYKHNIFKKISDEIYLILQKNKTEIHTPIESLYLLIALTQIGREYRLSPKNLSAYFNIQVVNDKFIIDKDLNYFNIVVLLFYIRDIEIYKPIKDELKKYILKKFKEKKEFEWRNETEMVMLLMDILTCPFLNESISKIETIKISNLINNIKTEFIKPLNNSTLDSYIDSLKNLLIELYKLDPIKERLIDMDNLNKLSSNLKIYLEELKNNSFFNQVYKSEQKVSDALDSFTEKFKVENKYKFKKDVLNLLEIKSYQKRLIESEKYWFIKWNDFDFGMELQAKKSQEVY